ncbi:hypothetical protein Tco_1321704 [Tanacetum coccineum]
MELLRYSKAVKEDLALNKKVLEANEAYTRNSNNITKLLSLANTFDFSGLKQISLPSKSDTSGVKSMMIKIYQSFKGECTQANTEEPPSHTEREHVAMKDDTKKPEFDKAKEEPTNAVPISTIKPTETLKT